jgi:Mg-chelatase subunit ChlD
MRKIQRAPLEVFNIAFLDIISCAFGAVIMLVLLAKNGTEDMERGPSNLSVMIEQVLAASQALDELKGALSDKLDELKAAKNKTASVTVEKKNRESAIPRAQQTVQQLKDKAKSLREEIRRKTAMLNTPSSTDIPDDDVGGIPTDADYVVFVIDNSGSMTASWQNIIKVVRDILQNHPKMKGFQVMAADGTLMFPGKKGQWLPDSLRFRKSAMQELDQFRGGSSDPEKGMMKAIDIYKNTKGKVSMYVFGDDYRPNNLDATVIAIGNKNRGADGKPVIRIHGIGFSRRQGNAETFAAFMQAVAKRNRGAFVGMYF